MGGISRVSWARRLDLGSVLAIVSKAVFDKAGSATGKPLAVGGRYASDAYHSRNKGLLPLNAGGDLYLLTVRPNDVAWLVAVLRRPRFAEDKWVADSNTVEIANVTALIGKLQLENGKGIHPKPGRLGMSLQTPRELSAGDVELLESAIGDDPGGVLVRRGRTPTGWLPIGAAGATDLLAQIEPLIEEGPSAFPKVAGLLFPETASVEFDGAFARVIPAVEAALPGLRRQPVAVRMAVVQLASLAGLRRGPRWIRPLMKDPSRRVRSRAKSALRVASPPDAALPAADGAAGWRAWDSGNVHAHGKKGLARRGAGSELRSKWGVPDLSTVGDVRAHLGIATTGQLRWMLTATDRARGESAAPYHRFDIAKSDGGRREICAPRGMLRRTQRAIYETILAGLRVHPAAHGFLPGKSVLTNASAHQGKMVVVKLDLIDFFPTIHYWRMVGLFSSVGYEVVRGKFGHDDAHRSVAGTLARLCTYTPNPDSVGDGYAPQGAPTSPAISNLVCRRFDARLAGLAERVGGVYTRYADDLTFSFDEAPSGGFGRFRWWVDEIVHQEGFQLNHRKFRILRRTQRQKVTGLVVNDGVGVPRRDRRRFRAIVHNCEKHGIESQRKGRENFEDWLRGYASWIRMVHPEEGAALHRRIGEILGGAS